MANVDRTSVVAHWFGETFENLHPLLQRLHRNGGRLVGTISIGRGRGISGWLGQRFAQRLGIPCSSPTTTLQVDIRHEGSALHWDRCFGDGHKVRSTFHPVGRWPTGYWVEQTGPVRLHMAVDINEAGWYWRCVGARVAGIPVPLWMFPRTTAFKRIEAARYRFHVSFALPLLGMVLWYEGLLDLTTAGQEMASQ